MNTKSLLLSAALLAVSMGALAADDKPADAAAAVAEDKGLPQAGDDCIFSRTVFDWQVIDDKTVAIWAPSRKSPYVVTLFRNVPGLRFKEEIGFEDHNGDNRYCDYGGDSLVLTGPVAERVSIASVRRSTPDEIKQLLVQAKEAHGNLKKAKLPDPSDMKSDKAGAPAAQKAQ